MFSTKSLAAVTAAFALISSSAADYNPSGKGNTAVYWVCSEVEIFKNETNLSRVPVDTSYLSPPTATTIRLILSLSASSTPS